MPEKRLQMEAGQKPHTMAALTDSGDHTIFTTANKPWSRATGKAETILPNGLRSGGLVTPKAATNDTVSVSALEANLNGAIVTVAADDVTLTRPAVSKVSKNSIILKADQTVDEVKGTDGDTFSETRNGDGGPPYIPVDAVEIAQVFLTGNTAALIAAADINDVVGAHREEAGYPLYTVDTWNGRVTFIDALGLDHTGGVAKRTYAQVYVPTFAPVPHANNVKLPEETYSTNSEQDYDGVTASTSKSLNQASFDVKLTDGLNDLVVKAKGENLWFKFFPDRTKSAYAAFQGVLGLDREFPAEGSITAAATVSCDSPAIEVPS